MKIKIPLPEAIKDFRSRPFMNQARGRFQAKADDGATQIDLYSEIGFFGVTAADFRRTLNQAGDIRLRINSPGGDVFDGIAIYNDLVDHPGKVDVEISGMAASAASIIAMAGDTVKIHESDSIMIHNAWGIVIGNRHDLEQVSGLLTDIDKALARIYADRTGLGIRAIAQMMDDETWMFGKKAVENGFADEMISGEGAQAKLKWDLSAFKRVPEELKGTGIDDGPEKEMTVRDMEKALRDAGFSKSRSKEYAAKAFGRDDRWDADLDTRRDAEAEAAQSLIAELKQLASNRR